MEAVKEAVPTAEEIAAAEAVLAKVGRRAPASNLRPLAETGKPVMKFYLRVGTHNGRNLRGESTVFKQGDIVPSTIDLERRFGSDKFRRMRDSAEKPISEGQPLAQVGQARPKPAPPIQDSPQGDELGLAPTPSTLDEMTVDELRALAQEEGIDIGKAKSAASIRQIILTAQNDG